MLRATSLTSRCRPLYRKSKPQRLPAEDGQRYQQHEPQQLPGGTGIVGGLFPRTQVAQQKVCQDIAGESNIFADWAASRQGCSVGGQMDKVQDKASDKDKERVMKNINIMWNALSKNRLFDDNKELKEFVMTLTGTLIFGENSEITPLPARTTDQDLIKAMMEGDSKNLPLQ
jgi:conjugative transfer pilus assembly protein TraH